jgi:hypothetical protein
VSKGNFVSFYEFGEGSQNKQKIKKFENLYKDGKQIENSSISEITWDQTGNIFMATGSGK